MDRLYTFLLYSLGARLLSAIVVFGFLIFVVGAQANDLPVFPGATGFGTSTPAGSGRHLSPAISQIIKVTSLLDDAPGSLRSCIDSSGPRVCIFEVGGRIHLSRELLIDEPYLTIAGQTAPFPGVLITGAGLRIATHDILIQHLQIRPGDSFDGADPGNRDAVNIAGKSGSIAKNIVLDHLSLSWAIDENLGIWYSETSDITVSNSIIAEGLYRSIHPKGPHSMGVLIGEGIKRLTLRDNLLAHNYDRNPRLQAGTEVEFVNNIVYGWGGRSSWNQANFSDSNQTKQPTKLFFAGNYYKRSPSSPKGSSIYAKPPAPGSKIFVLSNLGPSRSNEEWSEWRITSLKEKLFRSLDPPFEPSNVMVQSATETYQQVLSHAGSRPLEANAVDARIVTEVSLGIGGIKDCVLGCERAAGPYPELPSTMRKLSLPRNPHLDSDGDGYTNLEEWLHEFALKISNCDSKVASCSV